MGDLAVVELLLQTGADPMTQDPYGWKAKDHAAFRGWLPMAKKLASLTKGHSRGEKELKLLRQPKRPTAESALSANLAEQQSRKPSPDESYVFVNLGALDTYEPVTAVDLGPYVWPDRYDTQREADFFVTISAADGEGSENVVQLPVVEVGLFGALHNNFRLFLDLPIQRLISRFDAYPRAEVLTPNFNTGHGQQTMAVCDQKRKGFQANLQDFPIADFRAS